jgi:hypothetical protein
VAGIVEKRSIQRAMIGKTEGERPLPRPRGKREDKTKLIFWTWKTWLWSGFVFGDRKLAGVKRSCENDQERSGFIKCRKFCDWLRK